MENISEQIPNKVYSVLERHLDSIEPTIDRSYSEVEELREKIVRSVDRVSSSYCGRWKIIPTYRLATDLLEFAMDERDDDLVFELNALSATLEGIAGKGKKDLSELRAFDKRIFSTQERNEQYSKEREWVELLEMAEKIER